MYGFSGYGTSAYGSERHGTLAPVVRFVMRTVQNGYRAVMALMLRFRNLTLSNPSQNQRTPEL